MLERRLHIQDSKDCSCWPHDAIGYYNTNYSKTGKASLNADIFTCRCEWYWMMPKSQCQQGSTCVFRAFAAMLSMLSDLKDPFCNLCVISVPTLQTPRVFTAPSWRKTAVPCHDRLAGLIHLIPGVSGMWIHLAHSCNKVLCWTITFVSYCLLLQEHICIYIYIRMYIYIYKSYIVTLFCSRNCRKVLVT